MEFLDEEPRRRFFLQASSSHDSSLATLDPRNQNLPLIIFSTSIAFSISVGAFFLIESQTIHFFLAWIVCSLIIGPFAPSSYTGGNTCVGRGPIVRFPDPDCDTKHEVSKNTTLRRHRHRRSDEFEPRSTPTSNSYNLDGGNRDGNVIENGNMYRSGEEEGKWDDADVELLRKQMMKHPTGTSNRWDMIREAFAGRYKTDTIIKKSKALIDKPTSEDPYAGFLKNRKPLERSIEEAQKADMAEIMGYRVTNWSHVEEISLLNALKSFPKSVGMRWEKISAAVPGKSKGDCMKRVAELKRDFRNVKASPS